MSELQEIWKDVPEYEQYYAVSNLGRVKSKPRWMFLGNGKKAWHFKPERLLNCTWSVRYRRVTLCVDQQKKSYPVHVLVAKAFIPNPENKPFVDHIDTDRNNNTVSNLRWVTSLENANNPLTLKHLRTAKCNKRACINLSTGEKFRCIKDLADSLGRDLSVVAKACKHNLKTAGVYVGYL